MSAESKKQIENQKEFHSKEINETNNEEISSHQTTTHLQLLKTVQEKYKFNTQQLDNVLKNKYSPDNLIRLLELNFHKEFNSSAGVTEGHTIRKHTIMVMNQLLNYYYH